VSRKRIFCRDYLLFCWFQWKKKKTL